MCNTGGNGRGAIPLGNLIHDLGYLIPSFIFADINNDNPDDPAVIEKCVINYQVAG